MRLHHKNSFLKAFIKIRSNDLPEQWICDFLTTRAWHLRQDNLVITLLLEVIVINIIIIIVRVFFIAVSIVIAKFIPTINAAAKITPFTSCIPRLRSISLAQPGLTSGELPLLPVVVTSLLEPIQLERNPFSTQLHCHKVLNTLV